MSIITCAIKNRSIRTPVFLALILSSFPSYGQFNLFDIFSSQKPSMSFRNIDLGASEADVRIEKGEPNSSGDSGSGTVWTYYDEHQRNNVQSIGSRLFFNDYLRQDFYFNSSGQVVSICVRERSRGTDPRPVLHQISLGNSQGTVIEKLGNPQRQSINSAGNQRYMYYTNLNAQYRIKEGSVNRMCVSNYS